MNHDIHAATVQVTRECGPDTLGSAGNQDGFSDAHVWQVFPGFKNAILEQIGDRTKPDCEKTDNS